MNRAELDIKARPKNGKRNSKVVFILCILCITFISAFISYNYVLYDYYNDSGDEQITVGPDAVPVYIPLGSDTSDIAAILKDKGLIGSPLWFKLKSKLDGYDGLYKSGTHYISKDLKYRQMMKLLTNDPVSVKVLIPEGKTVKETANILAGSKITRENTFLNAIETESFNYDFLKGLPQRAFRLQGYLFPDTYNFDPGAGEKAMVVKMLDRFGEVFKPEYYEKAKALNMTVDQIVTLASIIEREASDSSERRVIAGVFYNRLKSSDSELKKLQSCATIEYIILNRDGKIKPKLTTDDTRIEDPYNTYLHEGLPPGPICNPGKDSIEAALNPEKTDYYYFVAKGDEEKTHKFSRTYSEHKAAVRRYQGGLY